MSIEDSEAVVPASAAFRAAMLAVRVRSVVIARVWFHRHKVCEGRKEK